MSQSDPRIRFQGNEYILVGGREALSDPLGAAIATREAYEKFESSYAHAFPDGRVLRHREQIGTHADIEFLDDAVAR